jgi:hypothetical protein
MREYHGLGTVTIPNVPALKGHFDLMFQSNGKAELSFIPEDQVQGLALTKMPDESGTFSGTSTNPICEIKIEKLFLTNVNADIKVDKPLALDLSFHIFSPIEITYIPIKMDDSVLFTRGLSNLLFSGTEIVQRGASTRVFGKTTWQITEKNVTLIQLPDYEEITKHLTSEKDVAVTCELKIESKLKEYAAFSEMAENLQNLFSLASANYVTTIYEDVFLGDQLCKSTLFPLKTYLFSNRPSLIDNTIHGNHEFKDFIIIAYPNYVNLKTNLGLTYFIEFFTTSKMYSPLEVEFILATTAFECLESYFKRWQSLGDEKGLKAKLTRMFSHFVFVASASELESYRVCRNSLTHEGKFPDDKDKFLSTMELRNLIDRFILTIMGYRNKAYYNYIKRDKDIVP